MVLKILLLAFTAGFRAGVKNVFKVMDGFYSFREPVIVGNYEVTHISTTEFRAHQGEGLVKARKRGEFGGSWMTQEKFLYLTDKLEVIDIDPMPAKTPAPKFVSLRTHPFNDEDFASVPMELVAKVAAERRAAAYESLGMECATAHIAFAR